MRKEDKLYESTGVSWVGAILAGVGDGVETEGKRNGGHINDFKYQ